MTVSLIKAPHSLPKTLPSTRVRFADTYRRNKEWVDRFASNDPAVLFEYLAWKSRTSTPLTDRKNHFN